MIFVSNDRCVRAVPTARKENSSPFLYPSLPIYHLPFAYVIFMLHSHHRTHWAISQSLYSFFNNFFINFSFGFFVEPIFKKHLASFIFFLAFLQKYR